MVDPRPWDGWASQPTRGLVVAVDKDGGIPPAPEIYSARDVP